MERGDIYHVDLNPIEGREQAGPRYVLIVTTREFNRLGTPMVCPITQGGKFARDRGFAVHLTGPGLKTRGVVLCNQLQALDLQVRHARFSERVPGEIIDEVLARISPLFE